MLKDNLRMAREKLGLKKAEVARLLEIPYSTYHGYETGHRKPDLDQLPEIAKTLNVDVNTILGWNQVAEIRIETQKDWDSVREWHESAKKLPALYEDAKKQLGTDEIRLVPSSHASGFAISYIVHDPISDRIDGTLDKLNDTGRGKVADYADDLAKISEYQKKSTPKK